MPPSGLALRACELGDIGEIVALEREAFPGHPYSRLDFLYYALTAREGFVVATAEGRVVGYVIAVRKGREGSIHSIAVLPSSRRKGIGEELMRSALARLGGAERVTLLVGSKNGAAVGLYRKLSFEETGRVVRRYYPDGDDAVEMERRL